MLAEGPTIAVWIGGILVRVLGAPDPAVPVGELEVLLKPLGQATVPDDPPRLVGDVDEVIRRWVLGNPLEQTAEPGAGASHQDSDSGRVADRVRSITTSARRARTDEEVGRPGLRWYGDVASFD
jgi:hypothetical protein